MSALSSRRRVAGGTWVFAAPAVSDTTGVPDTPRARLFPRVAWGAMRVRGTSMQPTLQPGDLLGVLWGGAVKVGDLVVAELPGGRGRGVKRATRREAGGWWLERDSAVAGSDSWLFGAVPDADVRAVVLARLWPRPRSLRTMPRLWRSPRRGAC